MIVKWEIIFMNVILLCNSSLHVQLMENYYENYSGKFIHVQEMEYTALTCMFSESWLKSNKIDIVVAVGNSYQYCDHLLNLMRTSSIPFFLPNRGSSYLEQSKLFTKKILKNLDIPTAQYEIVKGYFLNKRKPPFVVKYEADHLIGKQTEVVVNDFFNFSIRPEFVDKDVLVEDLLVGEEFSYQVICNESSFVFLGISKDHKRYKEYNTCGIASTSDATQENIPEIDSYIEKILNFLLSKNIVYKGIMYLNVMKVDSIYYILEINTRFGEPETQSLYPTLSLNFFEMFYNVATNQSLTEIKRTGNAGACIQLIHKDYSETRKEPCKFPNLEWSQDVTFGSQLKWSKNNVFGTLTASGKTTEIAIKKIYDYLDDKYLGDFTYKKNLV